MIHYLTNSKIDKPKWDDCVSKSVNVSIFVYSWYLDIVCEDWSALVLNDYEAIFPLASKSKYKISYLYQPFFTRYFGIYSEKNANLKLANNFFDEIPSKLKFLEFNLHESNSFNNIDYHIEERKFQKLNIGESYENIFKNYSDNTKRNLKKAKKIGLRIEPFIEPKKIVTLFKANKGNDLEVFDEDAYKTLLNLMNESLTNKKGQSIAAYDGSVLLAAAFFMYSNNTFTYLKSGITDEGKAKGAMHFLIDYFIKENSGENYSLDFGGSSIESVARFFKNFGAKDCVYLHVKKNKLPKIIKWVKRFKS